MSSSKEEGVGRGSPAGGRVAGDDTAAGSMAVGLEDRLPLRSVEPDAVFPAGPPHHFFLDRFRAAYRAELAAFTEVVAGRSPSPCTVADAVEAGWIAEACTLSLRDHRPVRMEEVRTA